MSRFAIASEEKKEKGAGQKNQDGKIANRKIIHENENLKGKSYNTLSSPNQHY